MPRSRVSPVLTTLGCLLMFHVGLPADEPRDRADRHVAGGEFIAAKQLARSLPSASRDAVLAQIAGAQVATGGLTAAAQTAAGINRSANSSLYAADAPHGASGGGAIADFDSLMDLIQTTVVPDTWEALGGPSTMSPYPAGVYVDAEGIIQDVKRAADEDQLTMLRAASLRQDAPAAKDWRQQSSLRKVSLRRLQQELARRQFGAMPLGSALQNLAGLSTIQYVFINEAGDDVILAGPVNGIRLDANQRPIDSLTGRAVMRLDLFARALAAAQQRQPFGCTIEPTPDGIVRTQQVTADLQARKFSATVAGPKLKSALGLQNIRVFGTADDTPMAMLMIEADRHMKMLALGTQPMPRAVANYLDIVEATIAEGPLTGSFLRLWFAPRQIHVRCDSDKRAFELSGLSLQLVSEQEVADALGRRTAAAPDVRAQRFAETFNRHFVDIAREYPLHDQLRGLYDLTAVAQLIQTYLSDEQYDAAIGLLAQPDLWRQPAGVVPRQTESLVVQRRFRKGRTIHSVVVASGGVQIDPGAMLADDPTIYETLTSVASEQTKLPHREDHWWWD